MNKQKQAFTLVELIVVITILAILGTIAFISLAGYSKDARNSVRTSDSSMIETTLELYTLETGKYPVPSNAVDITSSGATIGQLGTFGSSVTQNIGKLSEIPTDPKTESEYIYSVNYGQKSYSLQIDLEGSGLAQTQINQTHAAITEGTVPMVGGTFNGLYTPASNGNYIAVPSLLPNIAENPTSFVVNNEEEEVTFTPVDLGTPPSDTVGYKEFTEKLQTAYSGSDFNSGEYAILKSVESNTGALEFYAKASFGILTGGDASVAVNSSGGSSFDSSGDPYWDNVIFYSKFNDFTDETGYQTVTPGTGISIDTLDKQFGAGSAHMTGVASSAITINGGPEFVFGTNIDYTYEVWVKIDSFINSNGFALSDFRSGGANAPVFEVYNEGPGDIEFGGWFGGWNGQRTSGANIQLGQWHHLAISRSNGTTKLFVDGDENHSFADTGNYSMGNNTIRIGDNLDSGGGDSPLNGWLDEMRITRGVARYTESFDIQTSEHLTQGVYTVSKGSPSDPGLSCKDILDAGATTDGIYWIDPTGSNSFKVYCDMTFDGGGWTMIVMQKIGDPANDWNEGIQPDYNPTLITNKSFVFNSSEIPAHTQFAAGTNTNPDTYGYFDFVYTTGDIPKTLLVNLKGGSSYIYRDLATWYNSDNIESGSIANNAGSVYSNSFLLDTVGAGSYLLRPKSNHYYADYGTLWVR